MAGETILQEVFLLWIRDQASGHIASGIVKVDGIEQPHPIFKTIINGMKITKYIYLDDTEGLGTIQEAVLLDTEGNRLAIKPVSITKDDTGLLIAFEFEIKVEVSA